MRVLRMLAVTWLLQLKLRSRSAFDSILALLWPLFFATTIFLMFRAGDESAALVSAAVGASVMGIWSATSTTAALSLQGERAQGTLELLVAAPAHFALVVFPITLSMATVGVYSMAATLLWGRLVFGIDIAVSNPATFLVSIAATVLSIALLGFLLATTSARYRYAWALGSAVEMPVWLICGLLIPLNQLPEWVRPISWALAPTWGMSAIRASVEGSSPLWPLAACVGLGAAYGLIGIVLTRYVVNAARVHATLALS